MKYESPKQMTAFCIAQPWASCIFEHGKNVENRSANLKKRGTIAIYASKSKKNKRFDYCKEEYGIDKNWDDMAKGAILGFVDIVNVITDDTVTGKTKKWFNKGDYGYVLSNPYMLKKPVKVVLTKGAVIFWSLKGKALRDSLSQVPMSRQAKFVEFEIPIESLKT